MLSTRGPEHVPSPGLAPGALVPWSRGGEEGLEGGPSPALKLENHAALVKTLSCAPFPFPRGQLRCFGVSEKGVDTVSLPLGALPCCCVSKRRKPQGLGRPSRGWSPQSCAVGHSVPRGRGQPALRSLRGPLTPQTVEESLSCCLAGSSHSFAPRWKEGRSRFGTAGHWGRCEGKGRSPLRRF